MSASNAQVTRERITDYKPFLSSSANRRRSITDITPSTSAFSAMATRIAHGTNTTRVTRSCGTKARPVSHSSTPSHQASSPFTSDHLICRRSSRGFDQRDSNSWIVRSGLARRLPRAVRHHRPRPGRLSPVRPAARFVGAWVVDRLHVNRDPKVVESRVQFVLHRLGEVVAAIDRPFARHEHVQLDESLVTGLAGADVVEIDLLRTESVEDAGDLHQVGGGQRRIEQSVTGSPYQAPADEQDVDRNQDRHDRIQRLPSGHQNQEHTDDHPDRRPHIGQQMFAIGFQCHRPIPLARSQQQHRDRTVEDRGGHRDQPDPAPPTRVRPGGRVARRPRRRSPRRPRR